ncbi:MAG: thiamine-phosphate kinase [Candidatus Thermoplasmatota archaeon]|nr:thiamine-phosphate kinase [Candidatus Thermoplasmatota archaeon]
MKLLNGALEGHVDSGGSMAQTLKDIGERGLIELACSIISKDESFQAIGDDCAFISLGESYLLVSTDMISQQTHLSSGMRPWDIGWFVTAINLSDLAAKGGIPLGILLAYGLPKDMLVSDFKEIVKGADTCATTYKTSIIGGDTKQHPELVITGTSIGIVYKKECMSRRGAKEGDIIAVTGALGKAAGGFLSHKNGKKYESLSGLIHPNPRLSEGRNLAATKKVHCCMDISDGLSSSLYQLQSLNNIGFNIIASDLPLDPVLTSLCINEDEQEEYALYFGGDYELLLCISEESFPELKKAIAPASLTSIGKVTHKRSITIIKDGKTRNLTNKGYEHFLTHPFL